MTTINNRETDRHSWLSRIRLGPASRILILPNLMWLLIFLIAPSLLLFGISLHGYNPDRGILESWTASQYTRFLGEGFYLRVLLRTLFLGIKVTLWCLVLGYPFAVGLARSRGLARALAYLVVLVPLLTSAVIRTFGWMILLANNGIINHVLQALGITRSPIKFIYDLAGVEVALVEVLLPFMVLALDAALLNIPPEIYEAARNLGASRIRVFLRITLPLTTSGVVSGCVIVFAATVSSFVTPDLLGGPRVQVMATLIYQQGISLLNWPFGAAIGFLMLVCIIAIFATLAPLAKGHA